MLKNIKQSKDTMVTSYTKICNLDVTQCNQQITFGEDDIR